MDLTEGQKMALEAIEAVGKSHPNGGGIVVISGFAGTGKTTALSALSEEQDLLVLAPTGRAALRVREVSGAESMTVHRWLYSPFEDTRTGEMRYNRKDIGDIVIPENNTIFVDEASMVTVKMFKDLYETCKYLGLNLVFVGDGFQLPPIEMKEQFRDFSVFNADTPAHYRVQMTEVVRQALDSPIIRASMECRNSNTRFDFLGKDIEIVTGDYFDHCRDTYDRNGYVICHTNNTRNNINAAVRARRFDTDVDTIHKDEPLLVLQNNYEVEVYNGEIVTVCKDPVKLNQMPYPVRDRYSNETRNMDFYVVEARNYSGNIRAVVGDQEVFGTNGKVGHKAIRAAGKDLSKSYNERLTGEKTPFPVFSANFGYALTCHKAQGSEAPEVLVCIEQSARINSLEGRRWLYVALTRAKETARVCFL